MIEVVKPEQPSRTLTTPTVATLGIIFGLTAAGNSATAVALPDLEHDLGLSTTSITWTIIGFNLAFAATTALFGRYADHSGHRRALTVGIALMATGSLVSATAANGPAVIAGRLIQGAGGGAIPAVIPAIVTAQSAPGPARTRALTLVAAITAGLAAFGPLIGGITTTAWSWRLTIAVPGLALPILLLISAQLPTRRHSTQLDLFGATLVATATTGLVLALQSPTLGNTILAIGATLLVASTISLRRHVKRQQNGFVPATTISNPLFRRSAIGIAALGAAYIAVLFTVPRLLATEWTTLRVGALLVPAAAAAPLATRLTNARFRDTPPAATAAAGILAAGAGAALTAMSHTPLALLAAFALVLAGFGMAQPSLIAIATATVTPSQSGSTTGLVNIALFAGGSIGPSALATLNTNWGLLVIAVASALAAMIVARPVSPRHQRLRSASHTT